MQRPESEQIGNDGQPQISRVEETAGVEPPEESHGKPLRRSFLWAGENSAAVSPFLLFRIKETLFLLLSWLKLEWVKFIVKKNG